MAIASACNYDNPGFKVKETDTGVSLSDVSGSSLEATSQPQPTTTPTTTPTSDETTMTSAGPQVSGSDSDTSTSSGTSETSTSDATTGPLEEWDNKCDDPVISPNIVAVADTYFLNTLEMGDPVCSYNADVLSDTHDCVDLNAGTVPYLPMVFDNSGSDDPKDDLILAFGARFTLGGLMDGGLPVPRDAVINSTLELYFFRANSMASWGPPVFALYPLLPAGGMPPVLWEEGVHLEAGACKANEPTFRCLLCSGIATGKCEKDWFSAGNVFELGKNELLTDFDLGAQVPIGERIKLVDLDLDGTNAALDTGVLVMPISKVIWNDKLELKSRDYNDQKVGPFLRVRYCPNPNGP